MKYLFFVLVIGTFIQTVFCFVCLRLVIDAGARALSAESTVFAYEKMHNEKRWQSK